MKVFLSKYNWTPEYRGRGSLFSWGHGEKALCRSIKDPEKTYEVQIDSDLMKHNDAPGNGYVYEVVFLDGSGRWAISADQLEPCGEGIAEINQGRAELGLPIS